MFILIFIFIFILITEFNSKEFALKKFLSKNGEFNPYIFNFTLNGNQLIKYPSIFDTSQSYIMIQEENNTNNINNSKIFDNKIKEEEIKIFNKTFYYLKTNQNLLDKGYICTIGLSNKNNLNFKYNDQNYSYLYMIQEDEKNISKYVNFIQKEENEAMMKFGSIDFMFNSDNPKICNCKNKYWSCEIASLKIGGYEIYTPTTTEYGIFSISEEYIIAPKRQGNITLTYYKTKIKDLFNIDCYYGKDNLVNLICAYFNYEDLPDLSFSMKGGIQIMALSIDLFKILKNYSLEFKIKYYNNYNHLSNNDWYLGEPVVKNYNFLLNYTDENNAELIIIPSSLNGFIIIIVTCVGGFLFLFIFLTIIYCASKNDKKKRNSYFRNWSSEKINNEIFTMEKLSYIKEKVEESEEEDSKSDNNENNSNKSDDKSSDNNSDKDKNINDIEENKLDNDEEKNINIENVEENNNIDNLIINTNNKNDIINTKQNNKSFPINVELSINNYEDENDEENDPLFKSLNEKDK